MKHTSNLNNKKQNTITHIEEVKYLTMLCNERSDLVIKTQFGIGHYNFLKFTELKGNLVLEFKNQGKTIFISSHVLPEVETLCDRVAIIKNGQIIAEDKMADLKKKSLNRIEVQFSKDFDVNKLRENIGISKVTGDSNKYTFDIEGNLDKFIKELANHEIENLKTIEPDLEEIFLSYYGEQKS